MSNLIRIAVIDDHPLFREAVVSKLATASGIEIVGEGATAADALKIAQGTSPDVMLLEIRLPGGGIEAATHIARVCPMVRLIMLTASEDEKDLVSALQVGVKGYILKRCSGQEVVETVRSVARGDSYVAPNLAARLLMNMGGRTETVVGDNPYNLTSREAETCGFLVRGMSNKEIARTFKCTERTVKHHMTNVMQKLHVRNRVEAALKFTSGAFRPALERAAV
jgi:two-component system nitrate/nitrite response regulator NarL